MRVGDSTYLRELEERYDDLHFEALWYRRFVIDTTYAYKSDSWKGTVGLRAIYSRGLVARCLCHHHIDVCMRVAIDNVVCVLHNLHDWWQLYYREHTNNAINYRSTINHGNPTTEIITCTSWWFLFSIKCFVLATIVVLSYYKKFIHLWYGLKYSYIQPS